MVCGERAALQRRGVPERAVDPGRAMWGVLLGGPPGARTEAVWMAGSRGRYPSCAIPT
jgi:hypothetical protein